MQNSDEFKLNLNIAVTPVLEFTVAHVMNKKIIKKSCGSIMSPTPAALSALTAICSFNHADRLLREVLSQPFIQSWMANCYRKPHAAASAC